MNYTLHINGRSHTVDVDADTPLLWVLRDEVNLKGTKFGCGAGLCGACTVHLDGQPVRSCLTPISDVGAAAVTTIEGIGATPIGARLQQAWLEVDVVQCGYCQAGQIMSAAALLAQNKTPSDDDIDNADGRQHLPLRHLLRAFATPSSRRPRPISAPPRPRRGRDHVATVSSIKASSTPLAHSRRDFLKVSAAAGGGLLLSFRAAEPRQGRGHRAASGAGSTPMCALRRTTSSPSCRRTRRSGRASRPCCRC